ncbi:helix-hairpin-helix domain-containing protein [Robiginitalea sp. IMCC43444]|uniref:helix-hairpin-helix domain-containing protein n=1 Tax=Robiginitalea sp. IMCC43444 TaxID=3459121 RepID=UPI0040435E74
MRNTRNLVLGCALFSLAVMGCKQAKEKESEAVTTEPSATEAAATTPESTESTTVLNANLATEAELGGIGLPAETVTQILSARPFLSMNELDTLLGEIENKSEFYKKVFVPFNLNTTAEADFKMIPGVGDRMAHEFEEYRPYSSIQQFRREIGKYVDEAEVARYEYYVFIPVELNTASEADIKALPGVGDRMAHEFEEYRPYSSMAQFRKEIGKYVDDAELKRLERLVYLKQ